MLSIVTRGTSFSRIIVSGIMESKKSSRPTWTQVRELEARLESQIEGTSRLVAELNAWRERYRAVSDGDRLLIERNALEKSNALMEAEIERLGERCDGYRVRNAELSDRLRLLESRGFWSRLFNRKY